MGTLNGERLEKRRLADGSLDRQTNGPRLFSLKQAAAYLNVSYWTVRDLVFQGDLPSVRLGRRVLIDRHDLEALIEKSKEVFR